MNLGRPLPRAGEARRPLAVTVSPRPRGAGRLRRRGRWRELRRGGPLGLGDTKPPGGPAGLHGGCTESGWIRSARPGARRTGLRFPAVAAPIRPAQAQRVLQPRGRGRAAGEPRRTRGARGSDSGLPRPASPPASSPSGSSGAARGAALRAPHRALPVAGRPPETLLNALGAPKRWAPGRDGGSGRAGGACARPCCAPAQPAPHPGSELTLVY